MKDYLNSTKINYAHNPILPGDTFVPDVEAHVWEDGRVYLYGSFDIKGNQTYCSGEYHVYSSTDMINWTDHGVSFRLADTEWAKDMGALYAPDCAYRNGFYYLYYCVPNGMCGVAKSDKPYGPFIDVGPIENVHGIDPAVLIDDDGQAYLYWGQFDQVRVARLKDNMVEIEPDSAIQPLSVKEHEFHEGSSVKKIGGKYYYLFTDTHRHGNRATCLGYAVSDNPMTGFKYGGVILDNFGCDPESWNNHGSMECVNGQWYLFYHRSTHSSVYSRHVCVEPIAIEADGSIREIKMTSSGIGKGIKAGQTIPACLACELTGHARIEGTANSEHMLWLGEIHSGDSATYRYIDFTGESVFSVKMKTVGMCRIEVWIDGWYHASLEGTRGNISMEPITGRHTVTLRFFGDFSKASLEEFRFSAE